MSALAARIRALADEYDALLEGEIVGDDFHMHAVHLRALLDAEPQPASDDTEALAAILRALPGKRETETFGRYDRRRARAVLASDWLARHDAQVTAKALHDVADRLDVWEFPPGSDALEPMYRLVRTLRAEADQSGGDQ